MTNKETRVWTHVTPQTKQQLQTLAHQRGLSISRLICEILSRMLIDRGYPQQEAA